MQPNDPCPCGSGRKAKQCHGADGKPAPALERPLASDGFDPFAKIFLPTGAIDQEYARKRIGTLVDLLRKHAACYDLRVADERLTAELSGEGGLVVRDAEDQAAFEEALDEFSRGHLHELVDEDLLRATGIALTNLTTDLELSRRQRVAAAVGIVLLAELPDAHGLRGRSVMDLLFRVSLEELHAWQTLRERSGAAEDGLDADELNEFWGNYPALKHRYEERYRREVSQVVERVYAGDLPEAVSLDVALRGTETLMRATQAARGEERTIEAQELHGLLHDPFEHDMLDGGSEIIAARWQEALAEERPQLSKNDLRALRRSLGSAIRLLQDGGPGADIILFATYVRAITGGQFFVRDAGEAEAARAVFAGDTLSPGGVLAYTAHLTGRGEDAAVRRLTLAALELWPDHDDIRTAARDLAEAEMAAARAVRQGPVYDEGEDADAD